MAGSLKLPPSSNQRWKPPADHYVMVAGSSRTNNADGNALKSRMRQSELYATASRNEIVDTSTSKRRVREET